MGYIPYIYIYIMIYIYIYVHMYRIIIYIYIIYSGIYRGQVIYIYDLEHL